jgi:hypothetical protein
MLFGTKLRTTKPQNKYQPGECDNNSRTRRTVCGQRAAKIWEGPQSAQTIALDSGDAVLVRNELPQVLDKNGGGGFALVSNWSAWRYVRKMSRCRFVRWDPVLAERRVTFKGFWLIKLSFRHEVLWFVKVVWWERARRVKTRIEVQWNWLWAS